MRRAVRRMTELHKDAFDGPWPFVSDKVCLIHKHRSVVVVFGDDHRSLNGMAWHITGLPFPDFGSQQVKGVDVGPMIQFGLRLEEEPGERTS